jgi:hypothetical protein
MGSSMTLSNGRLQALKISVVRTSSKMIDDIFLNMVISWIVVENIVSIYQDEIAPE